MTETDGERRVIGSRDEGKEGDGALTAKRTDCLGLCRKSWRGGKGKGDTKRVCP